MKKPISKDNHILIDYAYSIIVPALPVIVEFDESRSARYACRILGAGALAYTLFTKSRRTPFSLISFKTHMAIDTTVSLLAMAAPWIFGFARNAAARNTLLGVGLAGLSASLLTNADARQVKNVEPLFI